MTKVVVEFETPLPATRETLGLVNAVVTEALEDSEVRELTVTAARLGGADRPTVVLIYGESLLDLSVAGPFWSHEEAEQHATEDARPSYWEIVDVEDTDG